jgi:hypothetical protein
MCVNKTAERGLGTGPELGWSETGRQTRDFIVEMDGVTQGKRPEITMVVLRPAKGGVNHHGPTGTDGMLDSILGNPVVMVPTNATVTNSLTFLGEFRCELPRGVNPVIRAVGTDLDTGAGGVALKTKLGLNCFGPSESNLMDHT